MANIDIKCVRILLKRNKINTSEWGKGDAKSIQDLCLELEKNECKLQIAPFKRQVRVALVYIRDGDYTLMESEQLLRSGNHRKRNFPLSEKIYTKESWRKAALRGIYEELGLRNNKVEKLHLIKTNVKTSMSISYPGIKCKYKFYRIEAKIKNMPKEPFWRTNIAYESGDPVKKQLWEWKLSIKS